jgi:hypothetical protein
MTKRKKVNKATVYKPADTYKAIDYRFDIVYKDDRDVDESQIASCDTIEEAIARGLTYFSKSRECISHCEYIKIYGVHSDVSYTYPNVDALSEAQ